MPWTPGKLQQRHQCRSLRPANDQLLVDLVIVVLISTNHVGHQVLKPADGRQDCLWNKRLQAIHVRPNRMLIDQSLYDAKRLRINSHPGFVIDELGCRLFVIDIGVLRVSDVIEGHSISSHEVHVGAVELKAVETILGLKGMQPSPKFSRGFGIAHVPDGCRSIPPAREHKLSRMISHQ